MRSLKNIASVVWMLLLPLASTVSAANMTYSVAAVALSGGYSIEGGYITTNGTLGPLLGTDIVDYRFIVRGLYQFEFSPASGFSPGMDLRGELVATPDAVYLPWSTLPQPINTFALLDAVGTQNYSLYYHNGVFDPHESASRISYFLIPSVPMVSAYAEFPQGNSLLVASIPEPSGLGMLIVGLVAAGALNWRGSEPQRVR